jgi:hypothetical protein
LAASRRTGLLVEIRAFDGDCPPDDLAMNIEKITEVLACCSESTDCWGVRNWTMRRCSSGGSVRKVAVAMAMEELEER